LQLWLQKVKAAVAAVERLLPDIYFATNSPETLQSNTSNKCIT